MTAIMRDKIWHLERINLFGELPAEDLKCLAERSQMQQIPGRTKVFMPGEAAQRVFFLKTGRIKLSRLGDNGRELTLGFIEPGEVFGELTGSDEELHETMAEAIEPSMICTMERREFEDFLASRPGLSLKIAKFMGFRLRRIEARIQDLLFLDVKSRIRKVLRDLADEQGVMTPKGLRLNFKLTHEDIANLVGTTRATATTLLGELRNAGELSLDGKFIVFPRSPANSQS
ncbi:MAG: Crp/Fnr family transcriptional regulator [Cyanobacteria bacterium NC_groundwater_1444_Ag_S-0.65um_54_12]|nr:Crp/Fnr family transcriptional regulator [Cyanobacteria bacterium NC_groundwater_1444_Ag_S-0.65um_54_12]